MNLKKILLVAGLGIMISNVFAQTSRRYTVAKPGTLVEMLTEEEANEITHLVLQGKLNAVDFRHLRDEFKKLQILDISNASISMYAGKNGTHPDRFYIYPANCIPSYAFCITGEIAAYAYQIFKENYNWSKPIRSVGVRGADLVTDNYWEQIDLFSSVEKREKQMKMDSAVDEIRRRFGFYSIQRGLMYRDRILSAVNAKEEHTVHPHGYFLG